MVNSINRTDMYTVYDIGNMDHLGKLARPIEYIA